jgi:hypothetical protein
MCKADESDDLNDYLLCLKQSCLEGEASTGLSSSSNCLLLYWVPWHTLYQYMALAKSLQTSAGCGNF